MKINLILNEISIIFFIKNNKDCIKKRKEILECNFNVYINEVKKKKKIFFFLKN